MTEYFTLEVEPTADPDVMELIASHILAEDGDEVYTSVADAEDGSPIAQTLLYGVEGIVALTISGDRLIITRDPDTPWEAIIDDVRDALRDFFL